LPQKEEARKGAMKCPKCNFENPTDTSFCGNCGTRFLPSKEIPISRTETLKGSLKELTRGSVFAGRYEVIEELGRGGMGKVYRVMDGKIEEEVALKLLRPEIASDMKTITRFKNELKFARKIIHKNVCRMYDLSEEGGAQYITMEYMRGEDLKSLIRRIGQFTAGKAIFIARQVCEGLAEAHKLGVVHRDLKPQNIMIDREGNSHIMDFGIAHSISTEGITDSGVIIGTPHYMAPEQVEGKEIDKRTDIYALGVILFEMLTGMVPFEGDTPLVIAVKHKTEHPPDPRKLNPQIPEEISRLILKCMEKSKNKRYQTVEDLLSELNRIKEDLPTTDRVLPEIKFEVGAPRRHIFLKILIFSIILIVGGYFFYDQILKTGKQQKPAVVAKQTTQRTAPLIAQSGQIEINSMPEGADVYINDTREGVTPFKGEFQPGTYKIGIKKLPGYEEKTDVVDIKAGESYSKNYILVAQTVSKEPSTAQLANIEINSKPDRADVYIDGKQEGITPFKRRLSVGTHRIRIKKSPEYKELTDVLNVKDDKPISKNYSLVPVYILSLKTDPSGADVSIDGSYVGKTPIETELQNKTCRLRIKKGEEWSSIDEVLTLEPGLNYLQRALKSITYTLTVSTTPPGTRVFIGEVFMGISPLKISNLFGTYNIKIEKEGYKTIKETIVVKSDGDKFYDLVKIKVEFVKIRFKANPYADVYIDGKLIGEVPPIRIQEVEEGKHKIEFVSAPLNKKYTVEVEIKAGESIEIRMNMETGEYKVEKISLTTQ
jgi:serine/threonine protein kinase